MHNNDTDPLIIMSDPTGYLSPDDMNKLASVFGVVEATTFEKYSLYKEWKHKAIQFESGGLYIAIGMYAGRPVVIQILFATLNGHLIMFWYSPSTVVNHTMSKQWLETYVGLNHRKTETFHTTDCMNFHTLVHAIERHTPSQADASSSPLPNVSEKEFSTMENAPEDLSLLLPRIASVTTPNMRIGDRILSILSTYPNRYREMVYYSELRHWCGVSDLTCSAISGTLGSLRKNGMITYSSVVLAYNNNHHVLNLQLTRPEPTTNSIVGLQLRILFKNREKEVVYKVTVFDYNKDKTPEELITLYANNLSEGDYTLHGNLEDPTEMIVICSKSIQSVRIAAIQR